MACQDSSPCNLQLSISLVWNRFRKVFKNVQDGDVFSQIHQVRNNKNDGYLEQWVYNLNPPSKKEKYTAIPQPVWARKLTCCAACGCSPVEREVPGFSEAVGSGNMQQIWKVAGQFHGFKLVISCHICIFDRARKGQSERFVWFSRYIKRCRYRKIENDIDLMEIICSMNLVFWTHLQIHDPFSFDFKVNPWLSGRPEVGDRRRWLPGSQWPWRTWWISLEARVKGRETLRNIRTMIRACWSWW